MKRFFLITVTTLLAALSATILAAIAPAKPASNLSRITFDEESFRMRGCNGDNSILTFTFASIGSGNVTIFVITDTGERVGQRDLFVNSSQTHAQVPIEHGYVGLATIRVEAENFQVKMGQKGDQTAANQTQKHIGLANCAMQAPAPQALEPKQAAKSFWETHGKLTLVALFAAVVLGVVGVIVWQLK